MNLKIFSKLKFSCAVALGVFLVSAPDAYATVLTFDGCGSSATTAILLTCNGGSINPNYGDRVSGTNSDAGAFSLTDRTYGQAGEGFTPNVLTTISSSAVGWSTGYGLLTNVIFTSQPTGILTVNFAADAGFFVRILSFDLGAFFPTGQSPQQYFGVNVSITNQGNVELFNQTVNPETTTLNFNPNATSDIGGSLTLTLNNSQLEFDAGLQIFDRESVAIDNIRFDQGSNFVPEPSSVGLTALGAGLIAFFRRKK